LHCIAGLDSLTSGVAYIGDTDLSALDDNDLTELRRDCVGFIFQAFNLIPTLNAYQNEVRVALHPLLQRHPKLPAGQVGAW
jgi:putative ABC transport system ATP-binding protein